MHNRQPPKQFQALFLLGTAAWLASRSRRPRHAILWSVACFLADLIAIPAILRAKPLISTEELDALRPQRIPAIDRAALRLPATNRAAMQRRSDRSLRLSVVLPALLLLSGRGRRDAADWLRDYVWGHALTYTIYTFGPLGPAFVDKFRPIVYRTEVPAVERMNGNNRNSQYSGHTGNAAFAGVFFARLLAQHVKLPAALAVLIAVTPAVITGSLRVRAQKHFPSDVVLASVIGAIIGCAFSGRPIIAGHEQKSIHRLD